MCKIPEHRVMQCCDSKQAAAGYCAGCAVACKRQLKQVCCIVKESCLHRHLLLASQQGQDRSLKAACNTAMQDAKQNQESASHSCSLHPVP
jgi:hypothetical protein